MRLDEATFGSGEDDAPDGSAVDTERIARALTYLRLPPSDPDRLPEEMLIPDRNGR